MCIGLFKSIDKPGPIKAVARRRPEVSERPDGGLFDPVRSALLSHLSTGSIESPTEIHPLFERCLRINPLAFARQDALQRARRRGRPSQGS